MGRVRYTQSSLERLVSISFDVPCFIPAPDPDWSILRDAHRRYSITCQLCEDPPAVSPILVA